VNLTLWHTHTKPPETTFRELVDEFNATVGAREGIFVSTGYVTNATILNEKLLIAADNDPGTPELPDITLVYPVIAEALARRGLLMDFASQFDAAEISRYVDGYVQEGIIDGALYVLPFAKSTEAVFLNKTIFDRFAAEVSGITLQDLETFEGITSVAEKYYRWSGGKTFFYPDDLVTYSLIGMEQMGDHFVRNEKLNVQSPAFKRIWDNYYGSAAKGATAISTSFGNNLAMTGDVVCVIASTASAAYFSPSITYRDNTREAVEYTVLPYPVFAGGEKVAVQRGAGMCVIKSTPVKEYGAALFLKWLTAPEQSLRFITSTGYLPVTKQAVQEVITTGVETGDDLINRTIRTMLEMAGEYRFFVPPVFEGFDLLRGKYVEKIQKTALQAREERMETETLNDGERSRQDLAAFIDIFGDN
jgi:multiple sugar transport system substrate-binding protein